MTVSEVSVAARLQRLSVLAALCALVACGGGGGSDTGAPAAGPTPSPSPAPAPEPAPTPAPGPAPAPVPGPSPSPPPPPPPPPAPPPPPDTAGAYGPSLGTAVTISRIDVGAVAPIHSPTLEVPQYSFRYMPQRKSAHGDFNGDGRLDIVICPSYFSSKPKMPCEFWLNRGAGRFSLGTSEVFAGTMPLMAGTNHAFVADFNSDGRDDVFLVNQGIEGQDPSDPEVDRDLNHVLLSQPSGKLADATSTALAVNPAGFHHISGVGDLDGDGDLDLAICELGGRDRGGVFLLLNNGAGTFTRNTASLPEELASKATGAPLLPGEDYLNCGAVQIADMDGDGSPELVAGTYISGSWPSAARELRIYGREPDGSYLRRASTPYPADIVALTDGAGFGFGASGIAAGDLDGDGRRDLILNLETQAGSRLVALRNDGGFGFTDVTTPWLGSRTPWSPDPSIGPRRTASVELRDLNGDGKLDLVLSQSLWHTQLANFSPFLLNDGSGRLASWLPLIGGTRYRGTGGINDSQWTSLLQLPYVNYTSLQAFDATGDGRTDWVFWDGLVPSPLAEPQPTLNGTIVDFVVFLRVLPQVP